MTAARRRIAAPLIVAAATLLVFWACVHNAFVSADDPDYLNHPFQGIGLSSLLGTFSNFHASNYVPLTFLSLSIDSAIWGMDPYGYHLTNVLLHAANAVIFYFLCLELLAAGGATDDDRPTAAAAALLFCLHPLRVQSVAWVAERKDVLCGVFFLLALLFWMRSHRRGGLNGARGKTASFFAFLLALFSKGAAIPLPLVLMILDFEPLRRAPTSLRAWLGSPLLKEKLPFLALAGAFVGLTVAAQSRGAIVRSVHVETLQKFNQIAFNQVFYLGKLLWPTDLAFYEWHWFPIRSAVILGTLAMSATLAAAILSRRLRAPLLAAAAYQTVMLAPVSGFITIGHEIVADRYSYLSGLGWAVLFGLGLRELARRHRTAAWGIACALLTVFAGATRAQIGVWRDSKTLWRQVAQVDPESWGARANLAAYLAQKGRAGEAILYLEEHLSLYPQDEEVRRALDGLIAKTGATVRDRAGFHEQLGLEWAAEEEFKKAAWHFERGLRYDPGLDRLKKELDQARLAAANQRPWAAFLRTLFPKDRKTAD